MECNPLVIDAQRRLPAHRRRLQQNHPPAPMWRSRFALALVDPGQSPSNQGIDRVNERYAWEDAAIEFTLKPKYLLGPQPLLQHLDGPVRWTNRRLALVMPIFRKLVFPAGMDQNMVKPKRTAL